MKNQKLLETIADISYIAGDEILFSGDSRADITCFILWAEEFEQEYSNWNEVDYRLMIERFAAEKFQEYSNLFSSH